MSADLVAEFGQPEPKPNDDDGRKDKPSTLRPQDEECLIPHVSKIYHAASPPQRRAPPAIDSWSGDDGGAELLFDASIDRDVLEDDFGDFESGEQMKFSGTSANLPHDAASEAASSAPNTQAPNLLELDESIHFLVPSIETGPSRNHEEEWGEFSTAASYENAKLEDAAASERTSKEGSETEALKTWQSFEQGEATFPPYIQTLLRL